MTEPGESGSKPDNRDGWQGRKPRDDTPSFIRNVQTRAELLHPKRNTDEHIPVLTMPVTVRIWRKVRWPLFFGAVALLLGAVALFTNEKLQTRSVEKHIGEAHLNESLGTIRSLKEAESILGTLAERHPERTNAQAAWAWHAALLAELFGPAGHYLARSHEALERAGPGADGTAQAARAAVMALSGDTAGALEAVAEGLRQSPGDPRLAMARCMSLANAASLDEAAEALDDLRGSHPNYLPALGLALSVAIARSDREEIRARAADLLERSPGDLRAALAMVAAELPDWGEDDPPAETVKRIARDMAVLAERVAEAPPKPATFGRYLEGRVALLAGRAEAAVAILGEAFESAPVPEKLAWYALAVRRHQGVDAALALIREHGDSDGAEVRDIKVRCLLDEHEVDAAGEALAVLEESGGLPETAAELRWMLAVRSGDIEAAVGTLPAKLGSRHWKPALEMYEQLRRRGDRESIDTLAKTMDASLGPCAEAIRAWHGPRARNALAALDREDSPCVDALFARLLAGRADPSRVEQAAVRALEAGGNDLLLAVTRARAAWLVAGRAAAATLLDAVRDSRADAAPLRLALAEAYLDIGLFDRGLAVAEELKDDPYGMALFLRALAGLGRGNEFQAALGEVLKAGKERTHPALAIIEIERDFELSAFDQVIEKADRALADAGAWTAEIADLKARALNATGSRRDADRALDAAARAGRAAAGQGEGWEADLALIRLNLRRGRGFIFRAQSVIERLYRLEIKHPELSYSYAVAHIRQENDRGAVRYLREALEIDPSFVPAYSQLEAMGRLGEEDRAALERTRPGTPL